MKIIKKEKMIGVDYKGEHYRRYEYFHKEGDEWVIHSIYWQYPSLYSIGTLVNGVIDVSAGNHTRVGSERIELFKELEGNYKSIIRENKLEKVLDGR